MATSYSQNGVDLFVYERYFKDKEYGVYLDIGAHNGIMYSTTKFFEELGWGGICVEPIPDVYMELELNRKCTSINCCVTGFNDEFEDFLIIKDDYSEMLSGIVRTYSEEHKQRIDRELGYDESKKVITSIEAISIGRLLNLSNALYQNDNTIDFLSIDTEGSEAEILSAIDYDAYDINVIAVEMHENMTKDSYTMLTERGYELVEALAGYDLIFKKKYA